MILIILSIIILTSIGTKYLTANDILKEIYQKSIVYTVSDIVSLLCIVALILLLVYYKK